MSDTILCFITFTASSRNSNYLLMNQPPIKYNFLPICRRKEKISPYGYCLWYLTPLGSEVIAAGSSKIMSLTYNWSSECSAGP